MVAPAPACGPIRFGKFEIDLRTPELRTKSSRIKLQEQPFRVLCVLLEQPGELVTREELRSRLWPADTFVDFDVGLNTAIKKLRDALGDSAENPRYIETIPRRGYRFIHAVRRLRSSLATDSRTIAVLPFDNLSRDSSQDYFAAGMTEELTSNLSTIAALRVCSRTSVSYYKQSGKPVREIARRLGADCFIEGSVTHEANKIRVIVQLIDAATDTHLWSERFERELTDVLALQGELARQIAQEIRIRVTPEEVARLTSRPKVNPEAYELYLQARFLEGRWNTPDLRKSILLYEQAIALASDFAPAQAGLGLAYVRLAAALIEAEPPLEVIPRARSAANTALRLDPSSAEACETLGWLAHNHDWDWDVAERNYRRAIELDPNYVMPYVWLGHLLNTLGRHQESLQTMRIAYGLDPLVPHVHWSLAEALMLAGKLDQSVVECRRGIDLHPQYWPLYTMLGNSYLWQEHMDEAVSTMRKAVEISRGHPYALGMLGSAYGLAGRRSEAMQILAELHTRAKRGYFSPAIMVRVYASLGDTEQSLVWMNKAFDMRVSEAPRFQLWGPVIAGLHSEREFQNFLERMRLTAGRTADAAANPIPMFGPKRGTS